MKKYTKLIILITLVISVVGTGLIIAFANQENEFEIPCEHEYQITTFDSNTGVITFACEICGNETTDRFVDHLNERGYEQIDMNCDGIINGKDFAYLMRNYDTE